jgi:pimeloyl-ACP methyl ester carboxylesterase
LNEDDNQVTFHDGFINLMGLRVHYLHSGDRGEPLLLLHGGGTDSAALSWGHLISRFANPHQVYAPDWPGYGESERPDTQYSIPYYISILTEFTEALNIERPSLAGISMGGAIGLGFTLNHPDRVSKLILVDSYGLQDRAPAHKLSYLFVRLPLVNELTWWTISRSRSMAAASLKSIFSNQDRVNVELVDLVFAELNKPKAGQAFRSFQMEEMGWNWMTTIYMDRLYEIQVPTLIVHGAKDHLVPVKFAEEAHSRIQGSKLSIIPDAGHWPQREKPEEFYEIVSAFLK